MPAGPLKGVVLDSAAIQRKMQQSSEISSILTAIFTEPEEPAPPTMPVNSPAPPAEETSVKQVQGLDRAHSALFAAVVQRPSWSSVDFEALCEKHNLMPAGAIDTLNEAAYDIAGEPLLEGDDDIAVNSYALEEMQK